MITENIPQIPYVLFAAQRYGTHTDMDCDYYINKHRGSPVLAFAIKTDNPRGSEL